MDDPAQEDRISVHAPRGMPAAMLTAYISRCLASLPNAKAALARLDYGHVRVFGHQLKGSGGGYGIPALTEMGLRIEAAAKQGDADKLHGHLDALEAYLGRLDILSD
jgi:HPt (histidine-containing phosphotransfer) domain-containing protein